MRANIDDQAKELLGDLQVPLEDALQLEEWAEFCLLRVMSTYSDTTDNHCIRQLLLLFENDQKLVIDEADLLQPQAVNAIIERLRSLRDGKAQPDN